MHIWWDILSMHHKGNRNPWRLKFVVPTHNWGIHYTNVLIAHNHAKFIWHLMKYTKMIIMKYQIFHTVGWVNFNDGDFTKISEIQWNVHLIPSKSSQLISEINPGVGVTKSIPSVTLFWEFFSIVKTRVGYQILCLYLISITAAQLQWYKSNKNVIQRI